mmetsp:Transcript_48839/g.57056  ORF Transcript_48839/g.57056 Transcript_48839/m.57056 type:complete len:89 (-) Transcript_48839:37-303(-)
MEQRTLNEKRITIICTFERGNMCDDLFSAHTETTKFPPMKICFNLIFHDQYINCSIRKFVERKSLYELEYMYRKINCLHEIFQLLYHI